MSDKIEANDKDYVKDGYVNLPASLGEASPLQSSGDYTRSNISRNYELLTVLYRENWIAKRIIDMPCEDATREWYTLSTELNQNLIDKIKKVEAKHNVKGEITNALRWARLYGGSLALIVIKGQEDMLEEPMDFDMIMPGSFKGLLVLDMVTGITPSIEIEEDMDDPDFGLPKYYDVVIDSYNGEMVRIHHSRVLRFIGRDLPPQEEIMENYWGASELEHIYEELQKRNATSANIAQLVFQANTRVLKMADYGEVIGMGTNKQKKEVLAAIEAQNRLLTSFGVQIMGTDDNMESHPYSFSGISEVYESFMMDMAGAANIPATKLFGRSPQGMNATGESDMNNYYESIAQMQERTLKPALEKLLPVICMSIFGAIPNDMEIVFEPIATTTPEQRAGIASQFTSTIIEAFSGGLIGRKTALMELKEMGKDIGVWTKITDETIEEADDEVDSGEMGGGEMPPDGGGMPPDGGGMPPDENQPPVGEGQPPVVGNQPQGQPPVGMVGENQPPVGKPDGGSNPPVEKKVESNPPVDKSGGNQPSVGKKPEEINREVKEKDEIQPQVGKPGLIKRMVGKVVGRNKPEVGERAEKVNRQLESAPTVKPKVGEKPEAVKPPVDNPTKLKPKVEENKPKFQPKVGTVKKNSTVGIKKEKDSPTRRLTRFIGDLFRGNEKSEDGGPGSGNFNHAGRPGMRGGSAKGTGGRQVQRNPEYSKKLAEMKEKTKNWSPMRKAEMLFMRAGMSDVEAVEAAENGTIDKKVDEYFKAMESNGDPTPTKPKRKQVSLYNEVEHEKKHNGDYVQARIDYIKDWTGCDDAEAKETLNQFRTWFGGGWTHADTNTIDSYIDKDGAYDGEIYRGMKFTEEEYADFMNGIKPGAKIGMKGYNSSWTNDREVAWGFSNGRDRRVIIRCVKNKTSAPVSHLSTQGEDEVIAHSKAQWTVLGVSEGENRTEITVIESEYRMSDSERETRRKSEFGGVVHDSVESFDDRMNEQSKYLHVVSEMAMDGGEGSGNFNHEGRPGERGGSAPSGGGSGSSGGSSEESGESETFDPFDIWEFLGNYEEPEETEEEKARKKKEEKKEKERNDYGQNGLSEEEYPENLRLTKEERDAIFDVYRSLKEPNYKEKEGVAVYNALSGFPESAIENQRKLQEEKVKEAEEKLEERKRQGYSYANTGMKNMTKKQKMELWNESVAEVGHGYLVGENGVKYWQTQRKKAKEELKWIDLATKIAKRREYAEKQPNYTPWIKVKNSANPDYKPWESEDHAVDENPNHDPENGRFTSGSGGSVHNHPTKDEITDAVKKAISGGYKKGIDKKGMDRHRDEEHAKKAAEKQYDSNMKRYENAVANGKDIEPPVFQMKSYFDGVNADFMMRKCLDAIDKGVCKWYSKKGGENKAQVTFNKPVGYTVEYGTGNMVKTNTVTVTYSRENGFHCYPDEKKVVQ